MRVRENQTNYRTDLAPERLCKREKLCKKETSARRVYWPLTLAITAV